MVGSRGSSQVTLYNMQISMAQATGPYFQAYLPWAWLRGFHFNRYQRSLIHNFSRMLQLHRFHTFTSSVMERCILSAKRIEGCSVP